MKKLALAAPVIALVLAGCAQDPTTAGRVGGQTISIADVDLLARVVCVSAAQNAPPVALGLPTANQTAITLLVETDLASRIAALTHVALTQTDEQQLTQYVTGVRPLVAHLSAGDGSRALELLTDNVRGQLQVDEVVEKILASEGQQPTQDSVSAGVQRLMAGAATQFGVDVNPRFGSYSTSAQGATSLSDAVSAVAKASQSDPTSTGGAAYVQGLPATQRCS